MLTSSASLIAGLILLIWGAERFVYGGASAARNFGISPILIGLTILALATSAPEILVSFEAATRGQTDLAIGNAIGSNIANIGFVLGGIALVKPLHIVSATIRREMLALLAVTLFMVALFFDLYLSRVDGLVLIVGLVMMMSWLVRIGIRSSRSDSMAAEFDAEIPKHVGTRAAILWLCLGLIMLLFGANLMVSSALEFARAFGVSELVIGVLLVALATSLPELAVSLVGALKGEYGLAVGNVIGSNMINSLAVVGVAATVSPAKLPPSVMSLHLFVMVAFTLTLFVMTYDYEAKNEISRLEGAALFAGFVVFVVFTATQNT